MADEPNPNKQDRPTASGETPAKKPAAAGGGTVTPPAAPGKPAEAAPPKSAAPADAGATAKPATPTKPASAAPPKPPAAPPKPPAKPEPWTSPLLEELRQRFPGAIADATIFRGQPCVTVAKESLVAICQFLYSDGGGAYTLLTDETAVDYPKREKRFEIIYQLYSFTGNNRLRLKMMAGEGEKIPSVVTLWPTANWLEREVYDMFGVLYEGHPDLKRILLPDGWVGHPLRKDYDILRQDQAWVKANLHIESGQ